VFGVVTNLVTRARKGGPLLLAAGGSAYAIVRGLSG
jgi:hypothetical protein